MAGAEELQFMKKLKEFWKKKTPEIQEKQRTKTTRPHESTFEKWVIELFIEMS